MNSTLRTAALALTIAFALSSCGGSDDTTDDTTDVATPAAISKADFLTKANAICKAGNAEIEAAGANFTTEEEALDGVKTIIVPGVRDQVADIRALGFPEGDEATLDGIFDATEAALKEMEADPSLAFEETGGPFADINADLTEYGLTTCGE